MSQLYQKIEEDFKNALRAHQKDEARVLRMIKSELQYATIEKRTALSDEEVIAVLEKMVKKRKDAIELYKKADRADHVQREQDEIAIIERYLPRALSRDDVWPIIEEVINEVGATGPSDFGKVMGAVMRRLKGQRVDGNQVRQWVQEALGQK